MVELPEESLAHYHRRASSNHIPIRLALHNLPDQRLLPSIRQHSFPNTGSDSQHCLRNHLSINCHLSLPRNETNPELPRTRSPGQEKGSAAENIKTVSAAPNFTAQGRRPAANHYSQTQTNSPSSGPRSGTKASPERTRGPSLKSRDWKAGLAHVETRQLVAPMLGST
jgi:hypothetical protein